MPTYYNRPLPPELIEAYENTDFCITTENIEIVIRLNHENQYLAEFLSENSIRTWAFITAWNPFSVKMPNAYNTEQQALLLEELQQYTVWPGMGRGRDNDWEPESSFFVANIREDKAIDLGQKFGQNAIIFGKLDGSVELKVLFESHEYRFINGRVSIKGNRLRPVRINNFESHPSTLDRVFDILNSEGPLLSLYKNRRNQPYLCSSLADGSGKVYYRTNMDNLRMYFNGELSTNELLERSDSTTLTLRVRSHTGARRTLTVKREDFQDPISCSQDFFTQLPQGIRVSTPERYLEDFQR